MPTSRIASIPWYLFINLKFVDADMPSMDDLVQNSVLGTATVLGAIFVLRADAVL